MTMRTIRIMRAKGMLAFSVTVALLAVCVLPAAAAGKPAPVPAPPEAARAPDAPAPPEAPPLVYVSEEGERIFLPPFGRHGAFLGVATVDLTPELCEHFGVEAKGAVMVSKVVADSPAEKAGVKVGDILLGVDGKPVRKGLELLSRIARRKEGEAVSLDLWRDERKLQLQATLAKRTGPSIRAAFLPGHEHSYDIKISDDDDDDEGGEVEDVIIRTPRVIHIEKLLEDLQGEGGDANVWVERLRTAEGARQEQLQKRIEELEEKLQALEEKMNKSKR